MKSHIERELKLQLEDEAQYAVLVAALGQVAGEGPRLAQTNVFFDTRDFALRRTSRAMVRIREEAGRFELTVKDRAARTGAGLVSRERTEALPPEEAQAVLRGARALSDLGHPLCRELGEELGAIFPIGGIANLRRTFTLSSGYVVEVDRTELPGRTDFEIEIELRDERQTLEGAREALIAALPGLDIASLPPSSPKYQRFLGG